MKPDPQIMPAAENGLVPTLNKMGWMTTGLDRFSQAFVDFAPDAPGPALDIGAAYGVASLAALKNGARVIANDLDPRHLDILKANAPPGRAQDLALSPGAFPDGINLPDGSVGAILVCRVLHFFDGPTVERSIKKMFSLLADGGKAFVVGETVYIRNQSKYIPRYEDRLQEGGHRWPGFFDDVHQTCDPQYRDGLPPQIHFFDLPTLKREFSQAGFVVEEAATFARPEYPDTVRWDGRESAGLIVQKPR